jgi:hypothetical protein
LLGKYCALFTGTKRVCNKLGSLLYCSELLPGKIANLFCPTAKPFLPFLLLPLHGSVEGQYNCLEGYILYYLGDPEISFEPR